MYCSEYSAHKKQDCLFCLIEATELGSWTVTLSIGAKRITSCDVFSLWRKTGLFFTVVLAYDIITHIKVGFVSFPPHLALGLHLLLGVGFFFPTQYRNTGKHEVALELPEYIT